MEPSRAVDAEVYASHFQFYVVDPEADWDPPDWNGVELEQHVGVGTGLVGIGTAAYEVVPVRLEVWPDEPPLDDGWDHVVEASLEVRSGRVGLGSVDGLDDVEPIPVEPATYRVRSSAAGLDGATEMDAGDSYRLQLWPAPAAAPAVIRWWPGWDPARATPRPTTAAGHVVLGADAHEARATMRWLASRGQAHLFRGCEGTLWEHSTLPDRAGTPQLERLDAAEAERRYGGSGSWGRLPGAPGIGTMARSMWRTLRRGRGRRPEAD